MVVHPLPYHAVVGLGHSALHVADDPDAASRDGDVHQKGMNILFYQSQDGGESLGGMPSMSTMINPVNPLTWA